MGRSISQPDRDERAQALKTIYDGLRMALDGAYAYQLSCLRLDDQANDQGEASARIVKEIALAPMPNDKRELTVKELADIWGVSDRSVYKWKDEQGLPFKKHGRLLRFDWIEADQWAKRHRESFNKARLRVVK
ncbi:MAG TPA: helix-turn-helix domain-containing protein [Blastocatellia bacterium]|nr:helix-turn-helix domain-containing protein [Blastocatellia bacterium]